MDMGGSTDGGDDGPAPADLLTDTGALLVRGPAMSGKYDLLLRLLAASPGRALLISTNRQAATAREEFATHADSAPLAVVDSVTHARGASGDPDPLLRYASSPENLTDIGVKFTDLTDELRGEDQPVAVGVHSLSELAMYCDTEAVFQFVRILLGECRDLDWPAVAAIDDTAVDDRAVSTLAQPFDAVVRTRSTAEQGWEFAVEPEGNGETVWTPF